MFCSMFVSEPVLPSPAPIMPILLLSITVTLALVSLEKQSG